MGEAGKEAPVGGFDLNSTMKTILFWVLILATAVLLYQVVQHTSSGREQVFPFSRFLEEIDRNSVKDVTIADSDIRGHLVSGGGNFMTLHTPVVAKTFPQFPPNNLACPAR